MNKKVFVFLVAGLIFGGVLLGCNQKSGVQLDTKVYIMDLTAGNVEVSKDEGSTWKEGEVGMELKQDNLIRTGSDSFCDVIMPDRGIFRIGFNSVVSLKQIQKAAERIKVQQGKIVLNITEKLKSEETFEVETRTAVAAVRGTKFVIEYQNGKMTARVKTGEVAVRRNIGRVIANKAIRRNIVRRLEVRIKPQQKIILDEQGTVQALKRLEKKSSNEKEAQVVADQVRDADQNQVVADDLQELDTEFAPLEKSEKVEKVKEKVKVLKEHYRKNSGKPSKADKKALKDFKNGIKKRAGLSSTADKKVGSKETSIEQDKKDKVADKRAKEINDRAGIKGIANDKVGKETTTIEQDKKDKVVEKVVDQAKKRSGQTGLANKVMNDSGKSDTSESPESALDKKMKALKANRGGNNRSHKKITMPGE